MRLRLAILAAVGLLGGGPAAAEWKKASLGDLELLTDASGSAGAGLLEELARVDGLFRRLMGAPPASGRQVRIFLFRDAAAFRPYALPGEEGNAGYYHEAPGRDYIAIHAGTGELRRVALHEYAHLVLRRVTSHLPLWLDEGLAEVYSTARTGAGAATLGEPIESHRRLLARRTPIPLEELFAADAKSRHYGSPSHAGLFYAQSWALVHMLHLTSGWRGSFGGVVRLLAQGEPVEAVFERLYGKTIAEVEAAWNVYRQRGQYAAIPVEPPAEADAIPGPAAVAVLTEAEAVLATAALARQIGRPEQAAAVLGGFAKRAPGDPDAAFGWAEMALARGDREEAARQLKRSIELGSRRAEPYFELAMLERDRGRDGPTWQALLERATELNPGLADAHYLLGQAALEAGRFREAIGRLERAAAVLPRRVDVLQGLATAYHRAGETGLAREIAHRCGLAASNDQERAIAAAVEALTESAPEAGGGPKRAAEVIVPESWKKPEGDASLEGRLERVDCLGREARLLVTAGDRTVALLIRDPGRVEIRHSGPVHFEFSCGLQESRRVRIEYRSRSDSEFGTEGDVLTLELLESL